MKTTTRKVDAFNKDILPLVRRIAELSKKHDIPCMMSFDVDDDRAIPNRPERHISAMAICRNPSSFFARIYALMQEEAPDGMEPEKLAKMVPLGGGN